MSIDLDWPQLSTLSNRLVDSLNRLLKTTERPSFLGPITVNGFEFGSTPPDVELVDVRDIYPDFLEDEQDAESGSSSDINAASDEEENGIWNGSQRANNYNGQTALPGASHGSAREATSARADRGNQEEEFEWVNRRGTARGVAETGPTYHPFPPHVRYGGASSASNILDSASPLVYSRSWDLQPLGGAAAKEKKKERDANEETTNTPPFTIGVAASVDTALQPEPPLEAHESHLPKVNMDNDLQFHLRVIFHSDMRINISTSLLLNYPSPLFMALPIRLTVVGFEFDGEVVAAYQPSKKRVHICVLDDDDPYRPATASNERFPNAPLYQQGEKEKISAGARLLPHIFIESEIGQADQQVLRNVSRVEKFIQDMVRMTLEQELVFPNFQTIVYGEEE